MPTQTDVCVYCQVRLLCHTRFLGCSGVSTSFVVVGGSSVGCVSLSAVVIEKDIGIYGCTGSCYMTARLPANIAVIVLTRWEPTDPVKSHETDAYASALLNTCKWGACERSAA